MVNKLSFHDNHLPLISIIIPIYNEEKMIEQSLPSIFSLSFDKEVIVVNDGSTDNSMIILNEFKKSYDFKLINLSTNGGKGKAIRCALKHSTGQYFIVYDADLEYDAKEIIKLYDQAKKIEKDGISFAVYGTRFINYKKINIFYLANVFLTWLTNLLFGSNLTDMETCFKLIPSSALKKLKLTARRFEIEPQITAKLLKNKCRIVEIPITYNRRSYKQGKKIKFSDGIKAVLMLFKERLSS